MIDYNILISLLKTHHVHRRQTSKSKCGPFAQYLLCHVSLVVTCFIVASVEEIRTQGGYVKQDFDSHCLQCLLSIVQLHIFYVSLCKQGVLHSRLPREQFITEEDYRKVPIKRISDAERIIII